jgi:hypothetical protein
LRNISVEVNGEGIVNMRSGIQMKLFEAGREIKNTLENICNHLDLTGDKAGARLRQLNILSADLRSGKHYYACTYLNLLKNHVRT